VDSQHPASNSRQKEQHRWYERAAWRLIRKGETNQFIVGATLFFSAIAAAAILMQWGTLNETLTETRNEFKAAQRAYVNLGSKTGVVAEFDTSTVEGKPIIVLHFTNGGQSTARHLAIQAFGQRSSFSFTHRHRFLGSRGDIITQGGANESDLAAQAERTDYLWDAKQLWSRDELGKANPNRPLFLIQGEIAYCDIFGVYHCQPFGVEYLPAISKFSAWSAFPNCYIERSEQPSWNLGGETITYKEIEPCEQPDEPEYYRRVDVAASITAHGDVSASVVVIPPKPTATPTPTSTK